MSTSENKLRVFVSSTYEDLRPYREKVIQLLLHLGYSVVSEEPTLELPVRRLNQIESCDLFIGIYPPDSGILPDTLPGYDHPLPLAELKHAGQTLRDCLVYFAKPELAGLELIQSPEPVPIVISRYPKLIPPSPPQLLRGLAYWKQAIRAWLWQEPTPEHLNEAERQRHKRKVEEHKRVKKVVFSQKQHEKALLEAEARAVFETARHRNKAQRERTLELLKEARNFLHRSFASENELLSLLQRDLNAVEIGTLLPFAKNKALILDRWQKWLDYHLESIREHLFYPRVLRFSSPVEDLLADFLSQEWHKRAEEVASEVVTAVNTIHQVIPYEEIQNKLAPYRRLPVQCESENYTQITQKLNSWCEGAGKTAVAIVAWIEQMRDKPARTGSLPYRRVWEEKVAGWQKSISHLEQFLDQGSYSKCLLITGRSGSGKTHLIARLLQQHEEELGPCSPHFLYISPEVMAGKATNRPTMEMLLMESARFSFSDSSSGPSWRSFTELARFVQTDSPDTGNKLVIVFDDLDVWFQKHQLDIADLCQFIQDHTQLHHVCWVLCLAENHFDLVSGPHYERFWKRFAYSAKVGTLPSGWVMLDRLNESSQQWRKIVAYQLEQENDTYSLDKIVASLEEQTRELIQIPFIAWLFGRFLHEDKLPNELRNLNYIEFVEAFWWQRLERLLSTASAGEPIQAHESTYWRVIYLIAGFVMETNNTLLSQSYLSEKLVEADGKRTIGFVETVSEVLERLVQSDLLQVSHDPESVGRYGNQVKPGGFPPMWHWKSGEYLVDTLRTGDASFSSPLGRIHELLETHFNEEELHTLCFKLGLDYEDLPAVGKTNRARELVQLLDRTGRILDLLEYGRQNRPRANWSITPGQVEPDNIEAWIQQYFLKGWSQEDRRDYLVGVLEFFILLLERMGNTEWPENYVLRITQTILRQLPAYQHRVWLASSKASGAYQYVIATWLKRSGPKSFLQTDQLHPFIYFLKYAAIDDEQQRGVSPVLRIQLLQPFFRDIRKDAYLSGFLVELVEKARNGSDAARALAYLQGIEQYLDSESYWKNALDLAQWVYDRLKTLAQNQLVTPVFDVGYRWDLFRLVHEWMLVLVEELASFQPNRGQLDEYDQNYWIQVIRCHCWHFAPILTLERLNWLKETGWFNSNRWLDVQYILEEQLTNTCGQWFREDTSRRQKQEYVTAVQHWAARSASVVQKKTALYLIYHTIPSKGQYANRNLAPELQQILKQLRTDSDWEIQQELKKPHISKKLLNRL